MVHVNINELHTRPDVDQVMATIMENPATSVSLSHRFGFNGENNLEFKSAQVQFGNNLVLTDFDGQTDQLGTLVIDQLTEEYKQKLLKEWKTIVLLAISANFVAVSSKLSTWSDKCDEVIG